MLKKEITTLRLLAPLSGAILPITEVPDPVFAEKAVGDGLAIDPTDNVLRAPCAGRIVQLHPSHHALTIQTEEGIQVLLHIGLDTVKLRGRGFTPAVKIGDTVKEGQALIKFDADLVAREARSLVSVMVIADAKGCEMVNVGVPGARSAVAGKDSLLEMRPQSSSRKSAPATAKEGGDRAESPLIRMHLPAGLHARPAALLASSAKKFRAEIEVRKGSKSANAKSVVGILGLEIAQNDEIRFTAQGLDAAAAVQELATTLAGIEEKPAEPVARPAEARRSAEPGVLAGVAASPGIAIGRVHQVRELSFEIPEKSSDPSGEKTRLNHAIARAVADLQELQEKVRAKAKADPSQASIFAAHQELLEDPDLITLATQAIEAGKTAAFAWNQATSVHADRLAHLNNELMANRANDLRDVGKRVLRILLDSGSKTGSTASTLIAPHSILIAENLTPSDTVQIDREKVLGFCTTTGGSTSHVAILARSLGLPAVAGIDPKALQVAQGTEVVIDGDRGELRLNPSIEEKARVEALQKQQSEKRWAALSASRQPAITQDGHKILVAANIGGAEDCRKAVEMGCDGVGLLRSEFLFLERSTAPSEEEQYRVYQEISEILGERPLTIRTLDVGGDKPLQYLPLDPEENPFLGIRGIRVGLKYPEILREQLRAILRVRHKGELNIMFPMIAQLDEFEQAKAILEEERLKLGAPKCHVGIMIEVPSAALLAEAFALECDFFSIGTNDLTQYTLAMDRGHQALAKQVDSLDPSVLRLIDITVQAAHRHGKWVGVCGGIASDAKAVPILLGLGVDELSVSLPVIPMVKSQVRESFFKDAQILAEKTLRARSGKEVRDFVAYTQGQAENKNRSQG